MSMGSQTQFNREKNLPNSEELPFHILQQFADGVWSVDAVTGELLYFNPAAEKIYDRQPEDFFQNRDLWQEIIHSQDRERVENCLDKILETETIEIEYRLIQLSGKIIGVREKRWAIKNEKGCFVRVDSIVSEIGDRHLVEPKLLDAEERFRTIADFTYDWEYWRGTDGNFIYVSPSCERITGYTADEFISDASLFNAIIHPGDRALVIGHLQEELTTEEIHSLDFRIINRNNEVRWIAYICQPVYSRDRRFLGRRASNRDITERKQAEQAALRLAENLEHAQRLARVGNWEFDVSTQTLTVSTELLHIFGLDATKPPSSFEQLFQLIHPEDREGWLQKVDRALAGGTVYEIDHRIVRPDGEIRYIQGRGEAVRSQAGFVIRLFETAIDVSDRHGWEEALHSYAVELKELARCQALQNRISNLIRSSLDIDTILETTVRELRDLLDSDRCYFLWYRQDLTPAEWEVVKEAKTPSLASVVDLYPGDALRPISENVLQTEMLRVDDVSSCAASELQRFFIVLDYISVLILRIKTNSGKIGALILANCSEKQSSPGWKNGWKDSEVEMLQAVANQLAIAIEQAQLYAQSRESAQLATAKSLELEQTISKLQQAQSQLVQAEKMSSLGQLVAGIAHEINNPISFIYGNLFPATDYIDDLLELLELYQQHYPKNPSEIQQKIDNIELEFLLEDLPNLLKSMKAGADRIRDIVKSLRTFSRLDESDMKKVDIHENIDSTLMILQNRLKAKANYPGMKIIKQYGKLPQVECYAGQLNQVFMHLLNNAIDALDARHKQCSWEEISSEVSTIWIGTSVIEHRAVRIRIADNGIGISSEAISKIFDPFYTTKQVGSGTGLGLSISYQIVVEKHRGILRCVSEEGVGTEFIMEIPLEQKQAYGVSQSGDDTAGNRFEG